MEEKQQSRESGGKSSFWRDQDRQGAAVLQEQPATILSLSEDEDVEKSEWQGS